MPDPAAIAALEATALRALMQAWLLGLPTVQPPQPNTPWLDRGTLRLTPSAPVQVGLSGRDSAALASPIDKAPLLSPTGT